MDSGGTVTPWAIGDALTVPGTMFESAAFWLPAL